MQMDVGAGEGLWGPLCCDSTAQNTMWGHLSTYAPEISVCECGTFHNASSIVMRLEHATAAEHAHCLLT